MNKTIITVQHTQSQHHTNGMIGAWGDWELTELGIKQAENIGSILSREIDYQNYMMYTSDLKRAYQTAQAMNKYLNLAPMVTQAIREVNAGDGNGKPVDWYDANKLPNPVAYDPDYKPFFNAESDRELWERLYPFCKEILSSEHEKIIIVSHGTTLSFLQSMIIGDSFEDIPRRRFYGCSGSVSKFTVCGSGKVIIDYVNNRYGG